MGFRQCLLVVLALSAGCAPPTDLTSIGVQSPPAILRQSPPPDGSPILTPSPTALDAGAGPQLPWPLLDDQPHPLRRAALPSAWPRAHFAVVGAEFSRWVVGDDAVVGLGLLGDGALFASTATGGLFSDRSLVGWQPLPTPLPPLARTHIEDDVVLSCAQGRALARLSLDGGRHWARLDFRCGDGARVALDQGRVFRIGPQSLHIWHIRSGQHRAIALPLVEAIAVGADGQRVVLFGRDSAFWSDDGGETFEPAEVPDEIPLVKQVLGAPKHAMIAVGEKQGGGTSLLLSRDDGRHWSAPDALPREAGSLWSVALDENRVLVATPRTSSGVVIRSEDIGRTWRAVASLRPMFGPAASRGEGVVAGVRGRLARAIDGPAIRPLSLDQPLSQARFTHPLIGIAIGVLSGAYCTSDGGLRWTLCSPELQLPFTVLDKADDHTYFLGGPGILRRSRDAGRSWSTVTLASPCSPRWVRFFGAKGMMACGAERYLLTDDAGRTWTEADGLPAAIPPPVWVDERQLVSVVDGQFLSSQDGGWSWAMVTAPEPDLVDVQWAPQGLSAISSRGVLGTAESIDGPWSWRIPDPTGQPSDPILAHRMLDDGRAVLLDAQQVYLWDGVGGRVSLGPVPGAHDLSLVGDGSLLVLQDTATTRFEGR